MENLAYDYNFEEFEDEPDYELIGGEKVYMSAAAPNINHLTIVMRLGSMFTQYIDEKKIKAMVMADPDVYFSDEDHFRPDLNVICDLTKVKNGKKVYGAPDLVVEVLSESTKDNDTGVKKNAYEKYGVKEYWIVNPSDRSIKVYHLIDGKFNLSSEYKFNSSKTKIKVSIFDDLIVDIGNIFKWWLE